MNIFKKAIILIPFVKEMELRAIAGKVALTELLSTKEQLISLQFKYGECFREYQEGVMIAKRLGDELLILSFKNEELTEQLKKCSPKKKISKLKSKRKKAK